MTRTFHWPMALLAAALMLPAAAMAQQATPSTAPQGGSEAAKPMPQQSRREAVEQRIADMHATLHISAAQEPQFDKFAQVMLDNAQGMDAMIGKVAAGAASRTADQAMEDYANLAERHAQDVRKLSVAFHELYTALPADQKKDADEMFRESAAARAQAKQGN